MATIRVSSSPASTCKVFKETIVGSGAYNIVGDFIPTTIEFDLDLDTLEFSNISVVNLGTVIDYNYDDNKRKTYISADFDNFKFEYARSGNITYGYGATPYYNGFTTGRYLGGMFNRDYYDIDYLYLAAYYNVEVNVAWLIPLCKRKDSNDYGFNVYKIVYRDVQFTPSESQVASLKKWVLDVFYGGLIYTELVLISPESSRLELDVGDSIQLRWGIELSNGVVVPYNSVTYTSSQALYYTVSDNLITLIEMPPFPPILITATANIDDLELTAQLSIGLKGPYYPNGSSRPSGGGGNYGGGAAYYPTVSLIPNGSAEVNDSNTGLYTRYLVGIPEMQSIGDYIWAEDLGLQIAKTLISLLYGDPISTIISCVSFPFALDSVGMTGTTLKWGGHDTTVSINRLNNNALQINWGYISIEEYWGNFLDYSPHTKMQLYLPWGTGFVDIDPNDVMNAKDEGFSSILTGNGTIGVITNIELSRGLCVHHVIANNTVIGTYSGSCGRQIPITGSDYGSKQVALAGAAIGAMVAGAVSAGAGAASGMIDSTRSYVTAPSAAGFGAPAVQQINRRFNVESAVSSFENTAGSAIRPSIACAAAVAVSPPHVSRSGSFQEGAGSLSPQKPYLIVTRPKMNLPDTYGSHYGYPCNISANLGSIRGYTEVGSVHLDGISATSEELAELHQILSGGIIL